MPVETNNFAAVASLPTTEYKRTNCLLSFISFECPFALGRMRPNNIQRERQFTAALGGLFKEEQQIWTLQGPPVPTQNQKIYMQHQGPYSEGKIPQKSRQKNSTDKNSDGLLCTVHPSPYIIWELSAALSALFQSLLAALGCLWWLCIFSCIILSYQTRSLRDFAVSWGPV